MLLLVIMTLHSIHSIPNVSPLVLSCFLIFHLLALVTNPDTWRHFFSAWYMVLTCLLRHHIAPESSWVGAPLTLTPNLNSPHRLLAGSQPGFMRWISVCFLLTHWNVSKCLEQTLVWEAGEFPSYETGICALSQGAGEENVPFFALCSELDKLTCWHEVQNKSGAIYFFQSRQQFQISRNKEPTPAPHYFF